MIYTKWDLSVVERSNSGGYARNSLVVIVHLERLHVHVYKNFEAINDMYTQMKENAKAKIYTKSQSISTGNLSVLRVVEEGSGAY